MAGRGRSTCSMKFRARRNVLEHRWRWNKMRRELYRHAVVPRSSIEIYEPAVLPELRVCVRDDFNSQPQLHLIAYFPGIRIHSSGTRISFRESAATAYERLINRTRNAPRGAVLSRFSISRSGFLHYFYLFYSPNTRARCRQPDRRQLHLCKISQ